MYAVFLPLMISYAISILSLAHSTQLTSHSGMNICFSQLAAKLLSVIRILEQIKFENRTVVLMITVISTFHL
jgi:hypothetical protein